MADRRHRALITRPQEDSADVAVALARRGITPVLAPVMRIEYLPADIDADLETAQAVLFTSRNGVRAFCRATGLRDLPVYAVGDSTADLARENGFSTVESANGDSADLARLAQERLLPDDGPLFHAAGATVAAGLAETLTGAGFRVIRKSLYDAKPVDALADETVAAIRNGDVDYVLFFSPRTARLFLELAEGAGLSANCGDLTAVCLSQAVSDELDGRAWKEIAVAARPATASLIAALERIEKGDAPAETMVPEIPEAAALSEEQPEETPAPDPPIGELPSFLRGSEESPARDEAQAETRTESPDSHEQAHDAADEPTPVDRTPPEDEDAPDDEEQAEQDDMTNTREPEPVGDPAPAAAAVAAPAKRGGSIFWSVVGAIAIIGIVHATLPLWRDYLPAPIRDRLAGLSSDGTAATETQATIVALKQDNAALRGMIDQVNGKLQQAEGRLAGAETLAGRLTESESALAQLREAQAKAAADAAGPNPLTDRIARLEAKLAEAETARTQADARVGESEAKNVELTKQLGETVASLNARIAELESRLAEVARVSAAAGKQDSIALAAGQLRDALSRSDPFAAELATLKKLAAADPQVSGAITPLDSLADKGVPSRAALFARLPAVVDKIVAASRTPEQGGWVDRAVSKLRGFVTVRRIDGRGDGADAAIARAELAARGNDLAGVVAELSTLQGPSAAAATDWLAAARGRLSVDAVRAALNKIVLSGLAAGG